ncbi:MAG: hypothetical protein E7031_02100 [Akkermansiaceae bacterium]|nr:hypothetical protein [Akkermansiaceae bacterium]
MTEKQIKAAIHAKGYTLKAFAEILGVAYETLRKGLSGAKPLTEQLRRHILLALQTTPANGDVRTSYPLGAESGFSLPPRIWHALDAEATAQGITTAEYTRYLVMTIANQIVDDIITHRPLE